MGSPRAVPVPCASTASMSAGASPAAASAARMTRCWAGPLGAVSPLLAPSWLTALPADHREDGMPVALGVGQPFQQQQPRALGRARCRRRRRRRPCTARRAPGPAAG